MKKSYYQLYTKLYDDYYLWVNFMNNSHLILNRELHDLYSKADDVENLKRQHTQLFDTLEKNGFIINDDFDELAYIEFEKKRTKFDNSLYHIIVNPTLDCNLSCWYCYEKKTRKKRYK